MDIVSTLLIALNSILLISILVVLYVIASTTTKLQRESDEVAPRVSEMATRALEIMDDPLKMVLPETPIAYNVARLLMYDYTSILADVSTLADAYVAAALLSGNNVGSPISVTVANLVKSVNSRLDSMTYGTGTSITGGTDSAALPASPPSEYFDPILQFLENVADANAWKTLGAACTAFTTNARAVDWSGSYQVYDEDFSGTWVVSETKLWNANSNVDDITTSIDEYCRRARDMSL